ncbi:ATP-dependent sacrificial sulfur transferase LarE [Fusibacter sp. JL298sf-3]
MTTVETLRRESSKFDELCKKLESLGSIVIAFSGGVDSTFLVSVASQVLKGKVLALTVNAPYIADWEIEEARALTTTLQVRHEFITVSIPHCIEKNPENRCYLCKTEIFSTIKAYAIERGFHAVCDGSNADDVGDYRPGMRALQELDIKSPLLMCGITKAEIRQWSKALNLETWDKPPYACLLTRLPYGTEIAVEDLKMIEAAEHYLIQRGIRAVRVRKHGEIARIEVDFSRTEHLLSLNVFKEISEALKGFGFKYVTLDLDGYTMGSFNRDLKESEAADETQSN